MTLAGLPAPMGRGDFVVKRSGPFHGTLSVVTRLIADEDPMDASLCRRAWYPFQSSSV
jgi:hypothetical protein